MRLLYVVPIFIFISCSDDTQEPSSFWDDDLVYTSYSWGYYEESVDLDFTCSFYSISELTQEAWLRKSDLTEADFELYLEDIGSVIFLRYIDEEIDYLITKRVIEIVPQLNGSYSSISYDSANNLEPVSLITVNVTESVLFRLTIVNTGADSTTYSRIYLSKTSP